MIKIKSCILAAFFAFCLLAICDECSFAQSGLSASFGGEAQRPLSPPAGGAIDLTMPSAHHLRLVFLKDSADFQEPGLYAFSVNQTMNALELGASGHHAACYSIWDSAKGVQTTYFAEPNGYGTLWSVADTGMGHKATVVTELTGAPFEQAGQLSLAVWKNNPPGRQLPQGADDFQVLSQSSHAPLHHYRYGYPPIGNVVDSFIFLNGVITPIGTVMNEATQRDLTGDGIMEAIEGGVWLESNQINKHSYFIIHNGAQAIDTILDDRYYALKAQQATTHDVNGDGIDEILSWSDANNVARFYQWNAAKKKFAVLDSIPLTGSLDLVPRLIDATGKPMLVTSQMLNVLKGGVGDTVVIFDQSLKPRYTITTNEQIHRFFTADLLGNGHRQIVIVTLNTKHNSDTGRTSFYATYVYDLDAFVPLIWADTTNFEAQFAADLQKTGHDQLIGLGTVKLFATKTVKLVDPAKNFQTAWTLGNDTLQAQAIVGPFGLSTMLGSGLLPGDLPRLMPTDVNGDGTLDFVVQTYNRITFQRQFLIVDAKRNVIDTINSLATSPSIGAILSAQCVSYDLNNNGTSELLFTETSYGGDNYPYPMRGTVWDWNAPSGVRAAIGEGQAGLSIYPNPSTGASWISISASASQSYQIRLISPIGQIVEKQSGLLREGPNTIAVGDPSLASGTYFVELSHDGVMEHGMLAIMR